MMMQLLETLKKTGGEIDGAHRVLTGLQEVAPLHPLEAAEAMRVMARTTVHEFATYGHKGAAYEIMALILKTGDERAAKIVQRTADNLVRSGHYCYRDLFKLETPQPSVL